MSESIFKDNVETYFQGYPICPGIAIGKSYFFSVAEEKIPEFTVPDEDIEKEVARYNSALKDAHNDLVSLSQRLQKEGVNEAAAIVGAHLEIIRDPLMTVQMEQQIRAKGKNTEHTFKTVLCEYENKIRRIPDTLFQERIKDVQDISRRVISHLRKKEIFSLAQIPSNSIVFAHELLPSDTAEAKPELIEAFVTRSGAETSHVAIMARARGIPFVSSVEFPDFCNRGPIEVIVDGRSGDVILNPSSATLAHYHEERKKIKIHVKGLQLANVLESETIDGYKIRLSANIEMFNEIDQLQSYGGEGIGLFRSEYLFLAKDTFPSEEEQFLVYRNLVEKVDGHPSVIRTFDIGGDKFGNFHPARFEKNPYLGCRAIRLMLKEREAFKTQIRAILRASAFGEVSILFPMISGLPELREAKSIVEEVKQELLEKGVPFARNIPIGCMVEVPSAAVTCDILAKECDFLSIGTNDLIQYSLAVDRGNPAMSYLYTPAHPSIIRLIKIIVQEGNRAKTKVSVCGEVAGDPLFTALLIGLGVHELSVSPPSLLVIKNVIRRISLIEATELAEAIFSLSTPEEIQEKLTEAYQNLNIENFENC